MRNGIFSIMIGAALLAILPAGLAADAVPGGHVHHDAVDRLGVPTVPQVAGMDYQLVFVSPPHPSGLVLQEYLPPGQQLDSYTSMLLLNHLPSEAGAVEHAQFKQQEVMARRASGNDPVANAELLQGPDGSALLDFLISATLPDGRFVLEWNVYHYRPQAGGVTMTALSRRAYGDEQATAFLRELKTRRTRDRDALLTWLPSVVRTQ